MNDFRRPNIVWVPMAIAATIGVAMASVNTLGAPPPAPVADAKGSGVNAAAATMASLPKVETRADQERVFAAAQELFKAGVDKYATDRTGAQSLFGDAGAMWRSLSLAAGIHNAHLELNIANASLLAGDAGRAIAAFKRAEALAPADPAVVAGLAAARRMAGTESLTPSGAVLAGGASNEGGLAGTVKGIASFLVHWADRTIRLLPPMVAISLAAGCHVIAFGLGAARVAGFVRTPRRVPILVGLAGLLIAGPVLCVEIARMGTREGVVVQTGVVGRTGPAEMYDAAFKEALRPGLEVRLIETRGEWTHAKLWDGRSAWVPTTSIERTTE